MGMVSLVISILQKDNFFSNPLKIHYVAAAAASPDALPRQHDTGGLEPG